MIGKIGICFLRPHRLIGCHIPGFRERSAHSCANKGQNNQQNDGGSPTERIGDQSQCAAKKCNRSDEGLADGNVKRPIIVWRSVHYIGFSAQPRSGLGKADEQENRSKDEYILRPTVSMPCLFEVLKQVRKHCLIGMP